MKWNWNAASAAHLIDTTVAIWKYCFERQTNAPRRRASGAWLHIGTAEMSPTKWLVDKRQTAAFPQQVRFVKQSIKLRQARQNQPAVKKESPTNRKQVESAIFVMCCNCKIFGCFYTVRLRLDVALCGSNLHFAWLEQLCICGKCTRGWQRQQGKGVKEQNKVFSFGRHWKSMKLST